MKLSIVCPWVRQHAALLSYLGLYLGIVAFILPPTGEFFLSDDGDYATTVLDWVENGRLRLTDFPSMTLLGHLSWGWLFAKIFGVSHTVLRVSTMVMAWIGALAAYDLIFSYRRNRTIAAFMAAVYVFNPLVFFYSYTFNTDVAGCSMLLVFLAAAHRIGAPKSVQQAIGLGGLASFSFLIRQTAALPGIIFGMWLVLLVGRREARLSRAIAYWLTFLVPIAAYFLWLQYVYGWPIGYEKKFLNIALLLNVKLVIVKILRMGMAMVLYGLPAVLLLVTWQKSQRLATLLGACFTLPWTFCMLTLQPLLPIRPHWDIDLFDCGIGKLPEIDGLVALLVSPKIDLRFLAPTAFEWLVVTACSFGSFLFMHALFIRRNSWLTWHWKSCNLSQINGRTLGGLTLVAQFVLALLIWIYYDRYFMPIVTLMLLQVAITPWMRRANLVLGNVAFFIMTVLAVLGTQDSKTQWEAGWKLARQLQDQSVSPYNIWLGHQYFVAESYPLRLRAMLETHGNRLRNLDHHDRETLAAWPREAQYHVRALTPQQPFDTGLPHVRFASWIREYRFQVYKKDNRMPYETSIP